MARVLLGDADTFVVHNRQPVQLPIRTIDRTGREIPSLPVHVLWLSGDSIPVSESGVVICLKAGTTILGATVGGAFARLVLHCRPVRTVRMAGPLDLVLGDSSRPLQAQVLGLEGELLVAIAGKVTIDNQSVVRVEDGRVTPLSTGQSGLELVVGDESAYISVHVYKEVADLDGPRPEEDHVALRASLRRGESRQWNLPAGKWVMTIRPERDGAAGLGVRVEGANCEALRLGTGAICLSPAGGVIRLTHPASAPAAVLRAEVLLRRTRA